jgi:DNA replication protein DnaC
VRSARALAQKLTQLKLGRLRAVVASALAQAEQQHLGYAEVLDELLAEELLGRHENQIRRKLPQACVPYATTLEQFDWQARPELKRARMMRYFDRAFVEKAGALLLIGPTVTRARLEQIVTQLLASASGKPSDVLPETGSR